MKRFNGFTEKIEEESFSTNSRQATSSSGYILRAAGAKSKISCSKEETLFV